MNQDISFSSDDGRMTREDIEITSKFSEDYFQMDNDPEQMPATKENRDWIYENIPDYNNVIRFNDEVIGYAFMMPCTRAIMKDFIEGRISESQLFEKVKETKIAKNPESLYLCASIVLADFRGRGLATTAFTKMISKLTEGEKKPTLFYWEYSSEGGRLARNVAKITGLELKVRKNNQQLSDVSP